MTPHVNAGTTQWLTVNLQDKNGALAAPTFCKYKIACLTTGTIILPDTPISPNSTFELKITDEQNQLINLQNRQEHRRITLTAEYGVGDAVTQTFDYRVVNLEM